MAQLSHIPSRLRKGNLMRHFLDHPAGWMPSRPAEIYDETSFWSARFGALLFDHLEIRRAIRGLDAGCGTGFPLIELAHLHGASSHFTGIDISVDALERARKTCTARSDQCRHHRDRRRINAVSGRTFRSGGLQYRHQ
jgi:SAM-dependent methyltransferase